MELIDRYVNEVVGLLPRRTRAEAERELRERIAARLEGRVGEAGGGAGGGGGEAGGGAAATDREAAAEAVLRELGPPERAAADLRPGRDWLIAPHLKRPFVTALTISLSALGALTLARVLTGPGGVTGEEGTVLDLLLRFVSALDELAVTALLLVVSLVGVFVVVERTAESEAGKPGAWEPRSLVRRAEKDPERVRWFGALLGIALGAAALVILHTYPVSLGATVNVGGVRGWVPLAVPAFRAELPWVDLWIVASMALQGVLLWRGRRSAATHAAEAGLSLLAAWIVQRVRTGGQILSIEPERMAEHGWPPDAIERYQEALGGPLQEVLEITLAVVLAVCLAETVLELYRAARAAWRRAAA